jgi:hypothetical protein
VTLIYCDYIADLIRTALQNKTDTDFMANQIIKTVGAVRRDLDDEDGSFVSPKKIIFVTDFNETEYRITIEETANDNA